MKFNMNTSGFDLHNLNCINFSVFGLFCLIFFTHRFVGDNEFYHMAYRHVLSERFSLAGQGRLVVDLCWWEDENKP